jgi:hypothetical protein
MASFVSVVIPPPGEVKIAHKGRPICETSGPYPTLAHSRGQIDISNWKKKLSAIANSSVWTEHEHQSSSTIKITRAAHDAWGIEKIIFTFCDDFLLKVIDLPNAFDPEWRELILAVYAAIGIEESRVVRCLLARMPAGVQIPVHHDTGKLLHCHMHAEAN